MNLKMEVARKQSKPNFPKKGIFLTPWYVHVRVRIRGVRNVCVSFVSFVFCLYIFFFLLPPFLDSFILLPTNYIFLWYITLHFIVFLLKAFEFKVLKISATTLKGYLIRPSHYPRILESETLNSNWLKNKAMRTTSMKALRWLAWLKQNCFFYGLILI